MMRLLSKLGAALSLVLALLVLPVSVPAQDIDQERLAAAVQAGDAGAAFDLAERYRRGEGVLQSYARAAELYAVAAEQGDARAMNALGALKLSGLGGPRDLPGGFALLKAAAQSGEAAFLHDLAQAYQQGLGTEPDPARAAELFQLAADQGLVEAAVSLGVMYQDGIGVARDLNRAMELYAGPAEAGHARAQNNLALILVRGEGGVPKDFETAAAWFQQAALQGLTTAMRNLAVMFENGFGVPVDEKKAEELYRLAAQGDAAGGDAELPLVFDPRLAPPDPQAAPSYLAAAKAGDPVAQFLLAYLQVQNARSNADLRRAAKWLDKAAASGLPVAMANRGILAFSGRGVLQDYVEGYTLLTLAAAAGLEGAIDLRDSLGKGMTSDQINAANAAAEAEWKRLKAAE